MTTQKFSVELLPIIAQEWMKNHEKLTEIGLVTKPDSKDFLGYVKQAWNEP